MKCKHTYPKIKRIQRYITKYFLMCNRCKKKIRKLNNEDKNRLKFVEEIKQQGNGVEIIG